MNKCPIEIGDEVIYPADNPRSQFISRVEDIQGDIAICEPLSGGNAFPVEISKLRRHEREST